MIGDREVTEPRDVNAQCHAFYETFYAAINVHFPTRKMKLHQTDTPWITGEIKYLIHKRQRVCDQHNNNADWKRLRNKIKRMIEKASSEYYPTRVQRLKKSNPAAWYREIRLMTGGKRDQPHIAVPWLDSEDSEEIANAINEHFISISRD